MSMEHMQEDENAGLTSTEDVQEQSIEQSQQPVTQQKDKDAVTKEDNLRLLRYRAESAERLQKERDEAVYKLRELEARNSTAQQPQQRHEELDIEDEGLVEGKHIKKLSNEIKELKQQLQQQYSQSNTMAVETKLKAQFPDIDAVLSKENIDILRATEPEFVQTIDADSNSYTKLVSAYKFIKNSGIYKDPDMYKQDIDRIQANSRKPKPLSSIPIQQGNSPLNNANAFANGLTPDLKKRLYAEMMEAAKSK